MTPKIKTHRWKFVPWSFWAREKGRDSVRIEPVMGLLYSSDGYFKLMSPTLYEKSHDMHIIMFVANCVYM
jgi:hypothetical protein